MEVMIQELQMLWDHGIKVDGVTWRVALVNGIWDGKGFEQVTATMGSGMAKDAMYAILGGFGLGRQVNTHCTLAMPPKEILAETNDLVEYQILQSCGIFKPLMKHDHKTVLTPHICGSVIE